LLAHREKILQATPIGSSYCFQSALQPPGDVQNYGADTRIRTADLMITNQLLYQLSYAG
jgi:hypothetical protein